MQKILITIVFLVFIVTGCLSPSNKIDQSELEIVKPALGDNYDANNVLTFETSILDMNDLYFCNEQVGSHIEFKSVVRSDFRLVTDWEKTSPIFDYLAEYRLFCGKEYISIFGVRDDRLDTYALTAVHNLIRSYGAIEEVEKINDMLEDDKFTTWELEEALIRYIFFSFDAPYTSDSLEIESREYIRNIKAYSKLFNNINFRILHLLNDLIISLSQYKEWDEYLFRWEDSKDPILYNNLLFSSNDTFELEYKYWDGTDHYRYIQVKFNLKYLRLENIKIYKSDQCYPSQSNCQRYESAKSDYIYPHEINFINYEYVERHYSADAIGPLKVVVDYFYEPVKVTINFETNGGNTLNPAKFNEEIEFILPEDPVKEGYIFSGWYMDPDYNNAFSIDNIMSVYPLNYVTIYAKWTIEEYAIIYNLDGGENGNNPSTYNVESNTILLEVATKEGYTFIGWFNNHQYTGEQITEIISGSLGEVNLHAKWTINNYTITFDSDGGSDVSAITQDYLTNVTAPENPSKEGYTFNGWDIDIPVTMPAEDITLTATWTINSYTITFDSDGGTDISAITQDYQTAITAPENPSKEGYTFNGWDIDIPVTMPAEDITLTAKWEINEYTITYGLVDDNFNETIDVLLLPGETIIQIESGSIHSLALTSKGRIFTWGYNGSGELGDGTTTIKNRPSEITSLFGLQNDEYIIKFSLGSRTSSAITSNGRIFTWGANSYGLHGDGTNIDRLTPTEITHQFNLYLGETIVQFTLGTHFSAALTSNGRIFTWGRNEDGRLGDGTNVNRLTPTEITHQFNLSQGETITQFTLGSNFSTALTSNGRIFTWGKNFHGQLGDGTIINRNIPIDITNQIDLDNDEIIIDVNSGGYHSIALTSNGRIFIWGRNHEGQLGNGTAINSSIPIEITTKFDLKVGEKILKVYSGALFSIAMTSEGRIFTWGDNVHGQLGDGTNLKHLTPNEITDKFNLGLGEFIIELSLGSYHSLALTSNGRVFSWGRNLDGQLGDGTLNDSYKPINPVFYLPEFLSLVIYDFNEEIVEFIPELDGYTYIGWFLDASLNDLFSVTNMPSSNLTLFTKWIKND